MILKRSIGSKETGTSCSANTKLLLPCKIMLVIAPHIHVDAAELQFTYVRSSGPGGQNVNKVNSKAVLRWNPAASEGLTEAVLTRFLSKYGNRLTVDGDLIVTSQRYRDQGRNTADCLEKLRELLLAVAVAPKKRRPTKPTRAARERRHQAKQVQARKKEGRSGKFDD